MTHLIRCLAVLVLGLWAITASAAPSTPPVPPIQCGANESPQLDAGVWHCVKVPTCNDATEVIQYDTALKAFVCKKNPQCGCVTLGCGCQEGEGYAVCAENKRRERAMFIDGKMQCVIVPKCDGQMLYFDGHKYFCK